MKDKSVEKMKQYLIDYHFDIWKEHSCLFIKVMDTIQRETAKAERDKRKNLTREFEKILMMLQEKFPEAFKYYTKRLKVQR